MFGRSRSQGLFHISQKGGSIDRFRAARTKENAASSDDYPFGFRQVHLWMTYNPLLLSRFLILSIFLVPAAPCAVLSSLRGIPSDSPLASSGRRRSRSQDGPRVANGLSRCSRSITLVWLYVPN